MEFGDGHPDGCGPFQMEWPSCYLSQIWLNTLMPAHITGINQRWPLHPWRDSQAKSLWVAGSLQNSRDQSYRLVEGQMTVVVISITVNVVVIPVWAWEYCRISPLHFLPAGHKRRLNQASFFAVFCVFFCIFQVVFSCVQFVYCLYF